MNLERQVRLAVLMVQWDQEALTVQKDPQVQAHLRLLPLLPHRRFLLVRAVLVDREILGILMDQEHQVNLQVLQDLIQEFLVCQMVRVVQIDQMVQCHQAGQQVLMDQVGLDKISAHNTTLVRCLLCAVQLIIVTIMTTKMIRIK